MGCFSATAPAPVNYGQETADTLNAQVALAPKLYASEAQYQPLYNDLALDNINRLLQGNPGGSKSVTSSQTAGQTGWYDGNGNFISPGELQFVQPTSPHGGGPPGTQASRGSTYYLPGNAPQVGDTWQKSGDPFSVTKTVNQAAQPGLLQIMQGMNTSARQADINDVANLGPQATQAMLQADPMQAELLQKLNAQANQGLDAGSMLTPDQQMQMQQASRAAFAARGMTGSNSEFADELLKQFNLGQQLLQQRQGFAASVLGANQQVLGDPMMTITGRPSSAFGNAQSLSSGAGPGIFNPQSPLAGSMAAGNQQMAAAFADPSTMSKIGSVMGVTGQLVGGIAGAMGGGI